MNGGLKEDYRIIDDRFILVGRVDSSPRVPYRWI